MQKLPKIKWIYLLVILLISGGVLVFYNYSQGTNIPGTITEKDPGVVVEDIFYRRGAEKPLVVLEEYSDFFCPHCANVQPIIDALLEEFEGKLALEYHHYSFMGSLGVHAGNECAGEQGKFWEFHEEAFKKQTEIRTGQTTVETLAEELALNMDQFQTCMDEERYVDKINRSMEMGSEKYGINATPTFVLDGKVVEIEGGKGYYEVLQEKINELINKPFA